MMKVYSVAEIDIVERSWVNAYVSEATKLVEQHGGRYLARTTKLEKVEGERRLPQLMLLIEWPSREAAMGFYESTAYRPHRQSRLAGSKGEFVLVTAEDVNRVARM